MNRMSPMAEVFIFTVVILIVGIFVTVYSDIQPEKTLFVEIGKSIGLTLISAGAIGIVVEAFVLSKMLRLEESFLAKIIPNMVNTLHEWMYSKGQTTIIDKDALYNLIGIGISQWFMKENFSKVGILPSKIAELYQEIQLPEFKEPLIMDFAITLRYTGMIDSKDTEISGLIKLHTQTQYNVFNSSTSEDRYVNTNGILMLHSFDIFTSLPKEKEKRKKFVEDLKLELTVTKNNDPIKYDTIPVEIDEKYLTRIEEKTMSEIVDILQKIMDKKIIENTTYLLYCFRGEKIDDVKKLVYAAFSHTKIKPQERMLFSHEIHEPFAESDYVYNSMKSLTKGMSVNLEGFGTNFETSIFKHFLNDTEDTIKHTPKILATSSLMLPRSTVVISWQKKKKQKLAKILNKTTLMMF